MAATAPSTLQLEAERLAGALPPLLVDVRRIAETVAQGAHGRRRVGPGEAFWQFRPYVAGDRPQTIDWRTSAKNDTIFVREMEWAAAATVYLWRDPTASMDWRSDKALPTKRQRADLILLALASLLLRGGERVALLGPGERPRVGRGALPALSARIARDADATAPAEAALPAPLPLPRHARAVLIGDFLTPLPEIEARLTTLSRRGVAGQLLLLLDPAETALPFQGRVRFEGLEGEGNWLVPRVETLRDAYIERERAHEQGLAAICRALGWRLQRHLTNQPASQALLELFLGLGDSWERRR